MLCVQMLCAATGWHKQLVPTKSREWWGSGSARQLTAVVVGVVERLAEDSQHHQKHQQQQLLHWNPVMKRNVEIARLDLLSAMCFACSLTFWSWSRCAMMGAFYSFISQYYCLQLEQQKYCCISVDPYFCDVETWDGFKGGGPRPPTKRGLPRNDFVSC